LEQAVITLSRGDVGEAEAVVKHAESGADHALRPRLSGHSGRRPRHADTRGKIAPVVNIVLRLIAQPETESEVRLRLPVIADECAQIKLAAGNNRVSGVDAKLRRAASELPDLCGGKAQLLEKQRPPIALNRADI